MSRYPLLFSRRRRRQVCRPVPGQAVWGSRLGAAAAFRPTDFAPLVALRLGLTDPVVGLGMGETAEILAREFGIMREEQDTFAARSHALALRAGGEGRLAEEIVPVLVEGLAITSDNGLREDSTPGNLARLKPAFVRGHDRPHGTVTAGNSSQITDGAVALLVASKRRAEELGLKPIARLGAYSAVGCDPARMGLGPADAIKATLEANRLALADADVLEINEAFAVQVLAVLRRLREDGLGEIDLDRLNPNGGSIALGHPVGATGARLVLTAARQLRRTGGRRALVSLCVGGGQGVAAWLEAVE